MSRNRVTTNTVLLAVMRRLHAQSFFSENRERKSDKSEGFKTNAVVSVFFLF